MLERFNKNSGIDFLLLTAISILIYIMSIYFIPLLFFILPAPLLVLGIKRGKIHGALGILVSTAFIFFLSGKWAALSMFVFCLAVYIPMLISIRRGSSAFKTMTITALSLMVLLVTTVLLASYMSGLDLVSGFEVSLKAEIENQVAMLKSMNVGLEIDAMKDYMDKGIDLMLTMIPGILFVTSMTVSILNFYLSCNILRRVGFGIVDVPRFASFRLPSNINTGVIITGLGVVIFNLFKFNYSLELALNVIFVFSFLFLLDGVAVYLYFVPKRVNKFLAYFVLVISLFMSVRIVFVILGIVDSVFNFRNWKIYIGGGKKW